MMERQLCRPHCPICDFRILFIGFIAMGYRVY
nr:MAG TPA: hypothetical protein [Bacteriophage sp.]